MQRVECSLLHRWAQGSLLLAKDPDQLVYTLSVRAQTHLPKFSETSLDKGKQRYIQS